LELTCNAFILGCTHRRAPGHGSAGSGLNGSLNDESGLLFVDFFVISSRNLFNE
jgi:hypothetical protein